MSVYTTQAKSMAAQATNTQATAPIPGREAEMAANNNGGFSFKIDKWGALDRFLLLGTESNGYTVGAKELTANSFNKVISCIREDGMRVVKRILEVSLSGRAPKNDPAVVALALAAVHGDSVSREEAFHSVGQVCRTGTWLFQFVEIVNELGKWNAATKRGISKWYTEKNIDKLALQMMKYQQRNGWSHRDVLRLAHVKPSDATMSNLFKYAIHGADAIAQGDVMPRLVIDVEHLKRANTANEVVKIINESRGISWEMVPTKWHTDNDVMMALLPNMGMTAVIRKLGLLTSNGLLTSGGAATKIVLSKLADTELLRNSRVHPLTLLQAYKQYEAGAGERGSRTWTPIADIKDALDDAFYKAFDNVEDTGASVFYALDVSPSMFGSFVNGSANLRAADVAGVLGMVGARTQKNHFIGGFASGLIPLNFDPAWKLDKVLAKIKDVGRGWGSTNISATYDYALSRKMDVDAFVVITDNDVNSGRQPTVALKGYRERMNKPNASQIVMATYSSNFTVADPKDPLQLDIAGFDSAVPSIVTEFMRASLA